MECGTRDDPGTISLSERPPNIILIVADDLGYNDISTFGGGLGRWSRVKTPHIDQLAADGVVFTQSYSGAGTCAPSRAMLMTGRYPDANRLRIHTDTVWDGPNDNAHCG